MAFGKVSLVSRERCDHHDDRGRTAEAPLTSKQRFENCSIVVRGAIVIFTFDLQSVCL
jgi:hypothetical protein